VAEKNIFFENFLCKLIITMFILLYFWRLFYFMVPWKSASICRGAVGFHFLSPNPPWRRCWVGHSPCVNSSCRR